MSRLIPSGSWVGFFGIDFYFIQNTTEKQQQKGQKENTKHLRDLKKCIKSLPKSCTYVVYIALIGS